MILQKKIRIVFNMISAVLAGIFLFDQVAWAGDLINAVLEQQYEEQSQTFAPDYIQTQQSIAENLIAQKQSIEDALSTQNVINSAIEPTPEESLDLQGPVTSSDSGGGMVMYTMEGEGSNPAEDSMLSVTTQAGDIINYRNGTIDSIEKSDGSVLRNLIVDEDNNLLGAEITYSDGTIQNIANGKVLNVIKPDGTIFNYDEQELLYSIIYADGTVANCSYILDGQGYIIETILIDNEKIIHYDGNDRLLKVEFSTGKTIDYDSGVVYQITECDGSIFIFNAETNIDNTITSSLTQYVDSSSTIYDYTPGGNNPPVVAAAVDHLGIVSVLYDPERKISQITTFDGTTQNYMDGLINSVSGSFGSVLYSYNFDAGNSIKKLAVDYDGIQNIYDEYGNIAEISADGVKLDISNGVVSSIKKDDGTLIEDALFDANNNIVSAKITRPDGVQAIYVEGDLSEVRQPDGSIFSYGSNGKIIKLVDIKSITYLYSDIEEGGLNFIVADAEDPDSITDPEGIVHQKYDSQMRLIEAVRKDGVTLTYSYDFDAEGNISSTIISDGNTLTTYDANNNIERTEILPSAEDPVSTISEYEYGRIRRVYKGNDLIYNYSYELDEAGKEITVVEDIATGEFKRYKDEVLVSVTDPDGLLTVYEYDEDNRISKATVTSLGFIIGSYTYTYEGSNTIIEDIDGVKRTYNADNKLIKLEEGNKAYSYTYTQDDAGTDMSTQELVGIKDGSGIITNYRNGNIESIVRPDGMVLTSIVIVDGIAASYTAQKDDTTYFVEAGHVAREVKGDGTVIEYYADGWTKSITFASGEFTAYTYEFDSNEEVNYIFSTKDETTYKFDATGLIRQVAYPNEDIIKYIYDEVEPYALKKYELIKHASHYFYDTNSQLIKVIDPYGREYNYEYTETGGSVTSIYTSKYSSLEDIISFRKTDLQFVDNGAEQCFEIEQYKDPNTALLLHLDGANGSTQTIDSSLSPHTVTFIGNTRLDTSNAKFGPSSVHFDGSGDYLMMPGSPDWAFGTGDFTVDGWIRFDAINSYNQIWDIGDGGFGSGLIVELRSSVMGVYIGGRAVGIAPFNFTTNRWYHIAVSRSGTTLRCFVDGTIIGSFTNSYNINASGSGSVSIGASTHGYYGFHGLIDEMRVTKGRALWTSAFTPPAQEDRGCYKETGELISGAIELNAATLNSISWNEFTPEGTDITIQTRTGDTPEPDDGAWDAWSDELTDSSCSAILSQANKFLQYKINFKSQDSSVSPRLIPASNGSFVRIDYVENSSNVFSSSTNGIDNGIELVNVNGIDTLRLPGYQDPSVSLLLHLDGANGSTQTIDSSLSPHTVTFIGNTRLDTSNAKFGPSSVHFDGSGDYLMMPGSPDWAFGTGDFTVDGWIRFDAINSYNQIWDIGDGGFGSGLLVELRSSAMTVCIGGSAVGTAPFNFTTNRWYHIAVSRSGTTLRCFVDGTIIGSFTNSYNINASGSGSVSIGASTHGYYGFHGLIDEMRVTKGRALWTSAFTPPQEEYNGLYKTEGFIFSNPVPIVATEIAGIVANVTTPVGTTVLFNTRTGMTANLDDGTWSQWADATADGSHWNINSPINKYLQYQILMGTDDPMRTPYIYSDGEALVKVGYIYMRSFDAQAPPDDLVFKDLLTITTPAVPEVPQITDLNPDFSYFDIFDSEIISRILPDSKVIQTKSFNENSSDVTVETTKDNKITYYVDGEVQATYQKHSDNHLELLTQYTYDSEGNLVSVDLPSARNSLDTQILIAHQQIAAERASYLRTLAEQYGLAYTQIRDQVQTIRDQINAERAQLQPLLYQQVTSQKWVGWWIFGWYETYTETIEVQEVRAALNQLNEQERQLNNEEANAYAQLSAQVESARQTLTQDEEAALTEVANQESAFQSQIITEESTPVILEYYRSILGRDPDEAETQACIDTVSYGSKIDVNALKNALINSQERVEQEAFVATLKCSISNALYNYIALDDVAKESFLGTIGLTNSDTVNLGLEDVDAILSVLNNQNIHFGRSAFVSLGTILSNNGITYNIEDLALKTVLVDILTGSLNKFNEGTLLELSMYSLSKTASIYGVELNNTRLNYDELTQAFNTSGQIIAHLRNNHYVVITNIAADGKISYKEHNRGQNGYVWTLSKEEFESGWTGYAIVQKTSAKGMLPDSVLSKTISVEIAQRIKGSCLEWLFMTVVWICSGIATAATAAAGAITAIVTGISAVIAPIITGIGELITGVAGFMTQIGGALFSAVQWVGTSLLPTIGGWIGGIGSWIGGVGGWLGTLGGIISPTGFSLSGLGFALGKTVVVTALSIGISKGLESLGVNSTISGLLSSFVTGGVSGIFNNGFSILSFLTGGMQGLAIQGVNQLGARLGIDPMLSSVISLSAGSIIGAAGNNISPDTGLFDLEGFSTSIGEQIRPNVTSELAYYGITKAGELLGVDPRISYLAGVGLRSTLNMGLSEGFEPANIWMGITNGLLRGATSIGLQWAAQELEIDPLIASLASNAIAGAIEGILEGRNPLEGIFDAYFSAGKGMLTLGSYDSQTGEIRNDPWSQAAYLAQVLDFTKIIQERGIVEALEVYATAYLHQTTINEIWKLGGIYDLLINSNQIEITKNAKGENVKRIYTKEIKTQADKDSSDYIDLSLNDDRIMGKREGNVVEHCEYGLGPDGKPVLKNGEKEVLATDGTRRVVRREVIENSKLVEVTRYDKNGNVIEQILPVDSQGIRININGEVAHGIRKNFVDNVTTTYRSGSVTKIDLDRKYLPTASEKQLLLDMGYTEGEIRTFNQVYTYDAEGLVHKVYSKIYKADGTLVQVNSTAGQQWLSSITENTRKTWEFAVKLASNGYPETYVTLDREKGVANIDMRLLYPGIPEPDQATFLQSLDVLRYMLGSNANWHTAIMDAVPEVGAIVANRDASFVFVAGVNSNGYSTEQLYQMKTSLNTTKTVVVGHSAGTELAIRSAFAAKADKYIIASPRMKPEAFYYIMQESGVRPDQVIIVSTKGDFYNWGGTYEDHAPYKWTNIYIESGPGVSALESWRSHGVPIDGWLSGESYSVRVNGSNPIQTKLSSIYRLKVEE